MLGDSNENYRYWGNFSNGNLGDGGGDLRYTVNGSTTYIFSWSASGRSNGAYGDSGGLVFKNAFTNGVVAGRTIELYGHSYFHGNGNANSNNNGADAVSYRIYPFGY